MGDRGCCPGVSRGLGDVARRVEALSDKLLFGGKTHHTLLHVHRLVGLLEHTGAMSLVIILHQEYICRIFYDFTPVKLCTLCVASHYFCVRAGIEALHNTWKIVTPSDCETFEYPGYPFNLWQIDLA